LVWLAGKEFLGSEPWKRWWINFVFLTWENGKRMTRSLRAMKAKSQGYQPCVYDCRCQPHKANKQRWHVKSETYCIGLLSQIVSAQIVSKNRKAREKSKVPRLHYKIIELGPRKNGVRVRVRSDRPMRAGTIFIPSWMQIQSTCVAYMPIFSCATWCLQFVATFGVWILYYHFWQLFSRFFTKQCQKS
jgi:hypothetical protein